MHIVYLHSHDMGRCCEPYHPDIATPAMRRLAEEGVLFRRAFCAGPTCSPSRAGLLTGQHPHVSGMLGLAHRGFSLVDPSRMLPARLRDDLGWRTVLCGIEHVQPFEDPGEKIGYTDDLRDRNGGPLGPAENAVGFIRDYAGGGDGRPFFLDVGFHPPHRLGEGFEVEGEAPDERFVRVPAVLPDTPEIRRDTAAYQASARTADLGFERVLGALEQAGLLDECLVLCTTDHGIAFPGMKCTLTDHGIGVALIVKGPASAPEWRGGKAIDAMVSQLDVYPTLCEMTGLAVGHELHGRSLAPLARGEASSVREELFAEVTYHAAYEPQRCVRTERWKYTKRFGTFARRVTPNCDNSPSKTVLCGLGWGDQEPDREALCDLVFDPMERSNLIGRDGTVAPQHEAALVEMRGCLERFMRETGDPLLSGDVRAPAGAVVTPQDVYGPGDVGEEHGGG